MRHLPEDMLTRELVRAINSEFQTEENKVAFTAELLHRIHSEQEGLEDVMSQ